MTLMDFVIKISLAGGRTATELRKIISESNKAKSGMNAAGGAATRFGGRLRSMASEASKANASLRKLARSSRMRFGIGGSISGVGIGATGGLASTAAAGAAAGGAAGAVNFDDMVKSTTVIQEFGALSQHYRNEILRTAQVLKTAPDAVAAFADEIARAGGAGTGTAAQRVANLQAATEGWGKAAVVAGQGVETLRGEAGSIGKMTALMVNNFRLSGTALQEAIADVAMTANDTTLDLGDFTQAMGKIAPEVAAVGGSFAEAILAAKISTRSGKTASLSGGQAASFFKDLRDPKKVQKLAGFGLTPDANGAVSFEDFLVKYASLSGQKRTELLNILGRYGQGFALAFGDMTEQELQQTKAEIEAAKAREKLDKQFEQRTQTLKKRLEGLGGTWTRLLVALGDAGVFDMLGDVVGWVADKLEQAATWITANKDAIREWMPVVASAIKILLSLAVIGRVASIFRVFGRAVGWVLRPFVRFYRIIGGWRNILGGARVALGWLASGFRLLVGVGGWVVRGLVMVIGAIAAIAGLPAWVVGAIIAAIAALAAAVWYYWDDIKAAVSRGIAAVSALGSAMWAAGAALMDGLWNGLKARGEAIWNWMSQFASSLISRFKAFFGIASPSKVFHGFGENLMQGLNLGMISMRPETAAALNLATAPLLAPAGFGARAAGGGSYTHIDNRQVNGATPRQVERAAKDVTTGRAARQRQGGRVRR